MIDTIFLFPYEYIEKDSCIGLYGAGRVGKDYYNQIKQSGYCNVITWMDSAPHICLENPLISSVEEGLKARYEILIIAILDEGIAEGIKKNLIENGMDEKLIFWKKPEKINFLTYITGDPFISWICKWRKEIFIKEREPFWDMIKDADTLFEAYKRTFTFGRFERREWYLNKDKKVAYLSNAKVGCTSLIASIMGYVPNNSRHTGIHNKLSKEALDEGQENQIVDFYKFTFVRNPFARLVSCYKNKYKTELLDTDIQECYFGRSRYLMGYLKDNGGFKEFVRRVCFIPTQWQDRHFRSQYDLIYKDDSCCVDYIGRFEELQSSYKDIQNKFGLLPLEHYNSSGETKWMEYYDMETAELVYAKYEQDIVTFGYEDDYQKLLRFLKNQEKNIE